MPKFIARLWDNPVFTALLALALVLALGFYYHADGAFYKWATHRDMLRQVSVWGILACGMTLVILSGGIDLSVSSVLALVAVSFSIFSIHWQWPAWQAIPAALAVGAVCGILNGGLIARFAIQPFVVTLAMMVFARGLAKTVSGGMKVANYVQQPDGSIISLPKPAIFDQIDSRLWGGNVAVVTLVFLVCVMLCWILLVRTPWGRRVYAVGGNEMAARFSGIPVALTKILAYGLCGFFAAVAGICQAAQETHGDPETGAGYELNAIAIVVIGGTNLMGGRGGIGLTLLGTLTIGYIDKILSINAVAEATRLMLTGGIIVAAVLLQRRRTS